MIPVGGLTYIHPSLEPLLVDIDTLHPHPDNPRNGDTDAIRESIEVNGLYRPIYARTDGTILAGNHTYAAALELGATHIPVVHLDVDDERANRIMLIDNRAADLGRYDDALLLELLSDLADTDLALQGTGYDDLAVTDITDALARAEHTPLLPGDAPTLADRFIIPPFTILDARSGTWQDRRHRWLDLGIRGEVGRTGAAYKRQDVLDQWRENHPGSHMGPGPTGQSLRENPNQYRKRRRPAYPGETTEPDPDGGTSVFDPVLTELTYRWFAPPNATILDPFAGGSVRGIVAAALGHAYTGIELRPEQITANREQWDEIAPILGHPPDVVGVKVSAAYARQTFHGCEPDYIRDVCHGRCCRSASGTMVTIHPSEQAAIEAQGGQVVDGLLQTGDGPCTFQDGGTHLCGLHTGPDKPFGCIASPFTLNDHDTLIVRNRYRQLCCYTDTRADGTQLPAYIAFRASLDLIFGPDESARICDHLDNGGGDLDAVIPRSTHRILVDNDAIKHGIPPVAHTEDESQPNWLQGDARVVLPTLNDTYDLLFSCPPYGDLEVYSDDPADLSGMRWSAFLTAYRDIIRAAADRLAEHRYAVWVVGEIRDKQAGNYRNLVGETIAAFEAAGMHYYNEAILVSLPGSLPVRTGRQFTSSRKLGKTHQNVLVFVKGDGSAAARACGPVQITLPESV